jgi:Tol biopolymer transport system component
LRNLGTATLTLVSQNAAGERGNDASTMPSISADGRYVAFQSAASNLVSDDTNGVPDIFVRDLQTGTTTRVSVGPSGAQANAPGTVTGPSISDDGRHVAFASDASNLVTGDTVDYRDAFVHDRMTGTTRRISVNASGTAADRATGIAVTSADGQTLAFDTNATNLVSNDTLGFFDVFVLANCPP